MRSKLMKSILLSLLFLTSHFAEARPSDWEPGARERFTKELAAAKLSFEKAKPGVLLDDLVGGQKGICYYNYADPVRAQINGDELSEEMILVGFWIDTPPEVKSGPARFFYTGNLLWSGPDAQLFKYLREAKPNDNLAMSEYQLKRNHDGTVLYDSTWKNWSRDTNTKLKLYRTEFRQTDTEIMTAVFMDPSDLNGLFRLRQEGKNWVEIIDHKGDMAYCRWYKKIAGKEALPAENRTERKRE